MDKIINSLNSLDNEIEDIFFNRPVNRAFSPHIGLVLSNNLTLNTADKLYSAFMSMDQKIIMVADDKLSAGVLPVDVKLVSKDKIRYSNTDEGIEALRECKIIIVIAGGELNSSMELFLNKLCSSYDQTIITDYPKLFDKTHFSGSKLYLLDAKQIKFDSSDGINKISKTLSAYSKDKSAAVIYFGKKQILALDQKFQDTICIINSANDVNKNEFVGILSSLLIDKKNILDIEWLRYCQAAGYLYRIYQKDGIAAVRSYLNDKF